MFGKVGGKFNKINTFVERKQLNFAPKRYKRITEVRERKICSTSSRIKRNKRSKEGLYQILVRIKELSIFAQIGGEYFLDQKHIEEDFESKTTWRISI